MTTEIDKKYNELIVDNPWIGSPITKERVCQDGVGHFRHYEKASIFWRPETGAHLIYGLIAVKYSSLGWERSPLGYPLTDEGDTINGNGRFNNFPNGTVIWKKGTNEAFAVYGDIYKKWKKYEFEAGFLGFPLNDESACPDGVGRYNHFDGGSIYWSPDSGAQVIYGLIRNKYAALGWEKSLLGYPVSDEADAGSNKGRYNNFQNGTIIWKRGNKEAFAVCGSIQNKWAQIDFDKGELGFPVTDELTCPDKIGRFTHFEGGSIYWTPETDAHIVKGVIRDRWAAEGWEVSRLQYPLSDEMRLDTKHISQQFEGGEITWSQDSGTSVKYYDTVSHVVSCNNLSAGKVDASQIYVEFWNDGKWKFHTHLYDNSIWYGDYYAIGFVFEGEGHGAWVSGELGAEHSGPSRTADKTQNGRDPWIEKFWHKVKNTRIHFHLHVKGDPTTAFSSLKNALENYGPALVALL